MPMESEAWIIITEQTVPNKHAVYVVKVSREEAERLRKRGIKTS